MGPPLDSGTSSMTGSPAGLSTSWVDVVDLSLSLLRASPSVCGMTTGIGCNPLAASIGLGVGIGATRQHPDSRDQVVSLSSRSLSSSPLPTSTSLTSTVSSIALNSRLALLNGCCFPAYAKQSLVIRRTASRSHRGSRRDATTTRAMSTKGPAKW